jgi:hypothetical protein
MVTVVDLEMEDFGHHRAEAWNRSFNIFSRFNHTNQEIIRLHIRVRINNSG